ncbi:MAG: hypothetical protein GY757_61890 [bacterium]|nr:hypothetical protein [bacterium]
MRKTIAYIMPVIAAVAAFLLPYSFIKQGVIRTSLDNVLHLKADPVFMGGGVKTKFMDAMGDDYGEGSLTYPRHQAFKEKGLLDMVRYTVHEPVTNGRWCGDIDFWQLAITVAKTGNPFEAINGFSLPVFHIYIDIDGTKGGSTETAEARAELVTFDEAHPWDFMVHVDGYKESGTVVSFDGTYNKPVKVIYSKEKKTIYIRLMLEDKKLKQVLDGRPTYHYVLAGAYDRMARGNFMPVKKNAGLKNGGGARSSLTPRIYDYIEPHGTDQKKILTSYDEESYRYAKLLPLEAKKNNRVKENNGTAELLKKYTRFLEKEKKNRKPVDHDSQIKHAVDAGKTGIELAVIYYQAGKLKDMELIIDALLEKEPENSPALTYKGTLTVSKARDAASLPKKMECINQAFDFYEKAIKASDNTNDLVTALMHRGNISLAVPDQVFHKFTPGIEDFLRAGGLLEKMNPKETKERERMLSCYMKVALGYEKAGKKEEAEIYFLKVKSFKNLPLKYIVMLLKRGYQTETDIPSGGPSGG